MRSGAVALLDEVAILFRRHAGASLSRSAMIRAIADAVLPLYPDWLTCRSEDELKERIRRQINRATVRKSGLPPEFR